MNKKNLSYGKLRGLTGCSSDSGLFCMLALDHRGVLKKALGTPDDPAATFSAVSSFKAEVIAAIARDSTAVLLDPGFGAGPAIVSREFPRGVGMIVSVEESGYAGSVDARESRIGSGWGVDKIKRVGATAVKLLVYYHPESATAAAMRDLVMQVSEACSRYDLPLFLEALTYSCNAESAKLSGAALRRAVVETARELTAVGGDVYKAEFPLDCSDETDEAVWLDACQELSEASHIPWVLLSAGVDFETFSRQTAIACRAGASGILAGRAIWKESSEMTGRDRDAFLRDIVLPRLQRLNAICHEEARPWTEHYLASETAEDWYRTYPGLNDCHTG